MDKLLSESVVMTGTLLVAGIVIGAINIHEATTDPDRGEQFRDRCQKAVEKGDQDKADKAVEKFEKKCDPLIAICIA
jgi:hypothetical protein